MIAKLISPIATGRISEWSTSVKFGIQPNPPSVSSVNVIWASIEPGSGSIWTMFRNETDIITHSGICPHSTIIVLAGWQFSRITSLSHCFLSCTKKFFCNGGFNS